MAKTLRYFMWGYQPYFRNLLKVEANSVFDKLAPELKRDVFLLGKLAEGESDVNDICLESGTESDSEKGYVAISEFFHISCFNKFQERFEEISRNDPEAQIHHKHPTASEDHSVYLKRKWIRETFLSILEEVDPSGTYYSSMPVRVNKFHVISVIRVDREQASKIYELKENRITGRYRTYTSLLDAAIHELLFLSSQVLSLPDPGKTFESLGKNTDEIIRSAGEGLLRGLTLRSGSINGYYGFYQACNSVSLTRYEGHDTFGKMILAKPGHPNVDTVVLFTNPVQISNYRAARKLAELSTNRLSLLCDSSEIYGLGTIRNDYDPSWEDMFTITFDRRHCWTLSHAGNTLMRVEDGLPMLPKKKISEKKMLSDLARLFPDNTAEDNKRVYELIEQAMHQKHGTMLVISPMAASEAMRLNSQCTAIQPVMLSKSIIQDVTSIDGAVLLDPKGRCHAIGVVLDGFATHNGDPSRGARYNSAIKYVESHKGTLAVVVSEDGSIDLIPDLMPLMPRKEIDDIIAQVKHCLEHPPLNFRKCNRLIEWARNHEFYMLDKDCKILNKLLKEVAQKTPAAAEYKYSYDRFNVHDQMDESYYI